MTIDDAMYSLLTILCLTGRNLGNFLMKGTDRLTLSEYRGVR